VASTFETKGMVIYGTLFFFSFFFYYSYVLYGTLIYRKKRHSMDSYNQRKITQIWKQHKVFQTYNSARTTLTTSLNYEKGEESPKETSELKIWKNTLMVGVCWAPAVTPVTLATQEAKIRRIVVWSQPKQIVPENLSRKYPTHKRAGR
jgi:hypothetical protein